MQLMRAHLMILMAAAGPRVHGSTAVPQGAVTASWTGNETSALILEKLQPKYHSLGPFVTEWRGFQNAQLVFFQETDYLDFCQGRRPERFVGAIVVVDYDHWSKEMKKCLPRFGLTNYLHQMCLRLSDKVIQARQGSIGYKGLFHHEGEKLCEIMEARKGAAFYHFAYSENSLKGNGTLIENEFYSALVGHVSLKIWVAYLPAAAYLACFCFAALTAWKRKGVATPYAIWVVLVANAIMCVILGVVRVCTGYNLVYPSPYPIWAFFRTEVAAQALPLNILIAGMFDRVIRANQSVGAADMNTKVKGARCCNLSTTLTQKIVGYNNLLAISFSGLGLIGDTLQIFAVGFTSVAILNGINACAVVYVSWILLGKSRRAIQNTKVIRTSMLSVKTGDESASRIRAFIVRTSLAASLSAFASLFLCVALAAGIFLVTKSPAGYVATAILAPSLRILIMVSQIWFVYPYSNRKARITPRRSINFTSPSHHSTAQSSRRDDKEEP